MKRARLVFGMMKFRWLTGVLSIMAILILKLKLPFKAIIRRTVFGVFCSGENVNEALTVIQKLEKYQVSGVLDYVAEGEKGGNAFEHNARMIVANILKLKKQKMGHSISLKPSGLEDVHFIKRIDTRPEKLEPADRLRYSEFVKRVDKICSTACTNKILVYIDAEEYATQGIFDEVAELMMSRYNKEKVTVFTTLQMYLRDRGQYLNELLIKAHDGQYRLGIKLVRGAYLDKERSLALEQGRSSPVFETKEETDQAFNNAVDICLSNHDMVDTCLATHNEGSIEFALKIIADRKLDSRCIKFSQLYGMSDNLTFNLAFIGYHASKYLPYGPVEKAIPYMIRRAKENTSIGGQVGRELSLIRKEIGRRNHDQAHAA